nr:NADH dehydrogenase subunit 2 [Asiopsocus sonorensis]
MYMNLNLIFFSMTLFSVFFTISSTNWMTIWLGLEINVLFFIPLILTNANTNSFESTMIYFIMQAIASSIFIFFNIFNSLLNSFILTTMLSISMLIPMLLKAASSPFHNWFVLILTKSKWSSCFLLMTLQKIIPLFMISMLTKHNLFLMMFSMLNISVGSIGGINQSMLKYIIAFSSINHTGWLIISTTIKNIISIKYMMIYSIMNLFLIFNFKIKNMMHLNQISKVNYLLLLMIMLSLAGLPPLMGFIPKWLVIESTLYKMNFKLILFITITSLLSTLYYLRMSMTPTLFYFLKMKWSNNLVKQNYIPSLMILTSFTILISNKLIN